VGIQVLVHDLLGNFVGQGNYVHDRQPTARALAARRLAAAGTGLEPSSVSSPRME
jgi:hypothetical protein